MRIYLAGPEVFLPDAKQVGAAKRHICQLNGFIGVFPLDNEVDVTGRERGEIGMAIYRANIELMNSCDLIIANVTPFRGPSADPGTAFEMGYMSALGRPVFAYSNSPQPFRDRVSTDCGPTMLRDDGMLADADGFAIEQFDMPDNLMLAGAARDLGRSIIVADGEEDLPLGDTTVFAKCVQLAAKAFAAKLAHP